LATLVAALLEVLEEHVEGLGLLSVVGHLLKTIGKQSRRGGKRVGLEQYLCVVTITVKEINASPIETTRFPIYFPTYAGS